jgi:uncharacterized protein (DUF885 family)
MSSPLQAFSDRVLLEILSEAPDLALNLGISEVAGQALPDAGLPDFSMQGADRRARLMDAWALELDRPPQAPDDSADALTRQVLHYFLHEGFLNRFHGRNGRALAEHVDPLTHLSGVHATAVEMFARDHPLAEPADAEHYVDRLSKLPQAIRDATDTLRIRRSRGYAGTRPVLESALRDIRGALHERPEDHLFYRTLAQGIKRGSTPTQTRLLERTAGLIEGEIRASYGLLLQELGLQVAAAGQSVATADPAFYRWRFAGHTTTALSPADAHLLGQDELRRVHAEVLTEFSALGIDLPLAEAFATLAAKDRYPDGERGRAEALAECVKQVADAETSLRPLFNLWPRAGAIVRPVELENEGAQHSHYVPPRIGEGTPGVFWVNLRQTLATPRSETAVVCFHETWPGHHVQLALAQELPLPAFRRAILFDGYMEGWAKYSESLPETVGLMNSPSCRIARLRMELYSTATLVLDTGVHFHGWSLDTAQRFFIAQTGASEAMAQAVILRSAADPGQLCAYKTGLLTMRKLRDRFRLTPGGHRIQDFHDAVLGQGCLPLSILETRIPARMPTSSATDSSIMRP